MSTAVSFGDRRGRSCVVVTMIAPGGHRSGSAVRIAATVQALSARFDVTVVLVTDSDPPGADVIDRCAAWCDNQGVRLEVLSATAVSAHPTWRAVRLWVRSVGFRSQGHRRGVPTRLRALAAGADLLWVFHLYPYMAGAVPAHGSTVVDIDDLKERLDPAGPGALALGRRLHLDAVRRLRRQVSSTVPVAVVSSPDDLDHLGSSAPEAHLALLPNTAADPPAAGRNGAGRAGDSPRVLMVGNLSYRPNAQAVAWFIDHVWPRIQAAVPSATFVVIGAGASGDVVVAGAQAGVEVLGEVPDLAAELSRATVSVAPVLAGTGTRVKIVEAFAWGLPVVSTSVGAAGLDVVDGRDLLLADDPASFASAVIGLLADRDAADRVGSNGRAVFDAHHHPAVFAQQVESLSRLALSSDEGGDGDADNTGDLNGDVVAAGHVAVGHAAVNSRVGLDITHVVLTRRFAGIERHVTTAAAAMAAGGNRVRIVCLDPEVMAAGLTTAAQQSTVDLVAAANWRQAAWEVARARRSDIVHAHTTGSLVGAVLGLVGRSTPLVVTRHFASVRWSERDGQGRRVGRLRDPGSGPIRSGPFRLAFQQWVEHRIDQQVAVSQFVADSVDQPAQVIYPGVTAPHHRVPASRRQQRVLVLQRLEPDKSTDVALRAWAASRLRHHGWVLDVVGDGSLRVALSDLTTGLGVGDSVVMHGHVVDVAPLLDRASMLLAPAADEPFGLSVVEAMAAGLPVVAAGGGGHLETLGRVADAGLFTPGDAVGAGAMLDRLGLDADGRQALADAQFAIWQQWFDLSAQVDVMERFYRRLAGR